MVPDSIAHSEGSLTLLFPNVFCSSIGGISAQTTPSLNNITEDTATDGAIPAALSTAPPPINTTTMSQPNELISTAALNLTPSTIETNATSPPVDEILQTTRNTSNESATGDRFLLMFTLLTPFDNNLLDDTSAEFQFFKTPVEFAVSKTWQASVLCFVLHILHIYSYCLCTWILTVK